MNCSLFLQVLIFMYQEGDCTSHPTEFTLGGETVTTRICFLGALLKPWFTSKLFGDSAFNIGGDLLPGCQAFKIIKLFSTLYEWEL